LAAPAAECPSPRQPNIPQLSQPLNLDLIKKQLRDYHDTAYAHDLADVIDDAWGYIEHRAGEVSKPALVLDIDETSLSNWPSMRADDFGYIPGGACDRLPKGPCGFQAWERKHAAPVIAPTLALFKAARASHVEVFFITGRHSGSRQATIRNLHAAGYRGWSKLFTRAADDTRRPVADYKSEARARIEAQGFTIIVNVGDQNSDLAGGHAECAFKLPNPFYFIP
jgi:predicted secreted acid phosphatase